MATSRGRTAFRLCLLAAPLFAPARSGAADAAPAVVEFNRDVRPILSDACFRCHGPDARKRKARLRLDTRQGAFADLGGSKAFVPGKPGHSLAWKRISSATDRRRMPPPGASRTLTPREKTILLRWIEQGAKWQKHWAFLKPLRPPLPRIGGSWPRNPIDSFVLARLERAGLSPSAEADKVTLLRRLTLDLTGLPPTPGEVDRFLADSRPGAYDRAVDRLLASPRYGERMAIRWLEAARYADTSGYQNDGERVMWRWRDTVIDSFNANLGYDRFTVEQLAGDLIPSATLEQVIASGFNRNHRGNAEGGIIPEEYAVEYVADRVETTSTVWLGLTMTCCRCHDHKYDPVKQKEFYQVFAFFNNVPERGKAVKYGNSPPMLPSPTRRQREKLEALQKEIGSTNAKVKSLEGRLQLLQSEWEKSLKPGALVDPEPEVGLKERFPLDGEAGKARFVGGEPAFAEGKVARAADLDGKRFLDAGDVGRFGFLDRFSLSAWVFPRGKKGGTVVSRMQDEPEGEGYSVDLRKGRVRVNLVKRWLDDALRLETEQPLAEDVWQHLVVTYDGSRVASGVKVYLDGRPMALRVLLDDLNQTFDTAAPFRIGAGGGPASRFLGRIGDVRIWSRALSPEQAAELATAETVPAIARLPAGKRTFGQAVKLRRYYLARGAPEDIREAHALRDELPRKRKRLVESFPTTMVMREMPRPRDTRVLVRGQYDKPGEKVQPGVPAALSPWPAGRKPDRLGFAHWLTDAENPLTARVAVNRLWQMLFGAGIVKTVDDFGAQGEPPSHPELLDWLAVEFRESGWDVKALLRQMVTSATYRQSSRLTPELLKRDPENRLLARGPRLRLPAEMIRDQALAASGLLVERLGGPSARPYQPGELWRELADTDYHRDKGPGLYRRGLYTFWKRTVAPPAMVTFDAAGREACSVRETRTNTPLQALNLLNDVTFVEASRVLAERVLRRGGKSDPERLSFAFRLVLARRPGQRELKVLHAGLDRHRASYRKDRPAALKLAGAGEAPRDRSLEPVEIAAYTAVCGVILNLDEAITKE
jgi:hypothetical protein